MRAAAHEVVPFGATLTDGAAVVEPVPAAT